MVYAVILLASLTAPEFTRLRHQGIHQTSTSSFRRSADNTKAIIKWHGDRPAELSRVTILFEGSRTNLFRPQNASDWPVGEP